MAITTLTIEEVEKIITEKIKGKIIEWDDTGSLIIEMSVDELSKNTNKKQDGIIFKDYKPEPFTISPTYGGTTMLNCSSVFELDE